MLLPRTEPSGEGASTVNKHTLICWRDAVTSCSDPPRGPQDAYVTAVSLVSTEEDEQQQAEVLMWRTWSEMYLFGSWEASNQTNVMVPHWSHLKRIGTQPF